MPGTDKILIKEELEKVNKKLQLEIEERARVEKELKSNNAIGSICYDGCQKLFDFIKVFFLPALINIHSLPSCIFILSVHLSQFMSFVVFRLLGLQPIHLVVT
jgi:hypothetical protein